VSVEVTTEGPTARLVVADDGRGFGPSVREQRHAQGHLGLSLAEALARQARGTLTIESSEGGGTRVVLEVPVE
jgi:two-component system NarL family sensor kinase